MAAVGLSNQVLDLHVDTGGRLWVGTSTGLASYTDGSWVNHGSPQRPQPVRGLTGGGSGPLWTILGFPEDTYGDVARYESGAWAEFGGWVTHVTSKPAAYPPAATGLDCFRMASGQGFRDAEGGGVVNGVPYVEGGARGLLLDSHGALWLSADTVYPLLRFVDPRLDCWRVEQMSGPIYGWSPLAESGDGKLWALLTDAQWQQALYLREGDGWVPLPAPGHPLAVGAGADGRLYMVSMGGPLSLWRLEGQNWEVVYDVQGAGAFIDAFAVTPTGDVWIALSDYLDGEYAGTSVIKVERSQVTVLLPCPHEVVANSGDRSSLALTGDGTGKVAVWFGDRAGLFRHTPEATAAAATTWGSVKADGPRCTGSQP